MGWTDTQSAGIAALCATASGAWMWWQQRRRIVGAEPVTRRMRRPRRGSRQQSGTSTESGRQPAKAGSSVSTLMA